MRYKRIVFALILVAIMVCSILAGCGGNIDEPAGGGANAAASGSAEMATSGGADGVVGGGEAEAASGSEDAATNVTVVTTAATTAGATAGNTSTAEAGEEYYELIFYRDYDVSDSEAMADRNAYRNYVLENFNIGWQEIHFAGDLQERLMIMLSSGDYPDIINPRQTAILRAYADAGALLDMGELFEKYAPNVLSRHADRIPIWKSISGMNDDKIWAMTMWEPNQTGVQGGPMLEWLFRSDILEQQGYPEIRDENDIYELLKKGLEDNPTTNGQPTVAFSHPLNAWGTSGLQCITYAYNMGRLHHMTFNRGMVFDFGINEFIDVAQDYSYRDGLAFFNRLYRDGLYDRDAVTDDWDEFESKMREGRILGAYFFVWPWDYDFNPALKAAGAPFRYVPMTAMLSSQREKGEKKIYAQNSGEVWSSTAITINAKYPERIAKLMDWQASEEGMLLAGWGREGIEYTVEDGRRVATENYFDRLENDPEYTYELFAPSEFGFYLGVDNNGQSYRINYDADVISRSLDPIVKDVWAHYGWTNSYDMYYKNSFIMDETEEVDLKNAVPTLTDDQHRDWERIDADTHDFTMQLITAASPEAFDQIYEKMLARRAELGHKDILKTWNEEYKELRKIYGFD